MRQLIRRALSPRGAAANDSGTVGVRLYSLGQGGSADISDYLAFDGTSVDAHGRFAVDIATDATAPCIDHSSGARAVMVRTLHRHPTGDPARLVITGCAPIRILRWHRAAPLRRLGRLADAAQFRPTFLEWSAATSAAINTFHAETPHMAQGVQGDSVIIYFLGSFNLGEGEWLEVTVPAGIPGYWSLHAYNY